MIDLKQRSENYANKFPKWPAPRTDDRWLDGIWVIGNNYKGSGYYGAYPPNYLERVLALFPDAKNILHLFSGSLDENVPGTRFDMREEMNPDVVGDAHDLGSHFSREFDLVLADPPYSAEDADHYGTPWINRNKVIKEVRKVLIPGGNLVWLDQVLPMYRKDEWNLWGLIGIVRSTNHRFRVASMFEAKE